MPHKHKRKRRAEGDYELPPTQTASPLPARSGINQLQTKPNMKGKKRDGNDDAPRAFRRLMAAARGRKTRPGLDDGARRNRTTRPTENRIQAPHIRSGEDIGSFAARVDAALPLSGLSKKRKTKDGKDELGLKVYRTRKERKMHKLYDQWRVEERKIQSKREEELEQIAEREIENDSIAILSASCLGPSGTYNASREKARGRRPKACEGDPWACLKRRRAEATTGLHDVVSAPPDLHITTRRSLGVAIPISL
ncbi:hypothetical protein CDD83_6212 [Cordyceps sp. RAO-2017]|nr:hypothetical protein CDD83_6212 [Cordyceps sp. RAO-2017]